MLSDMIVAVMNAKTPKEKEKAYRQLERVGMDRMTVNVLIRSKDEWMEKEENDRG